jgi:hypothetical protein
VVWSPKLILRTDFLGTIRKKKYGDGIKILKDTSTFYAKKN